MDKKTSDENMKKMSKKVGKMLDEIIFKLLLGIK